MKQYDPTTGRVRDRKTSQTVWLIDDKDDIKMYHCNQCRTPVVQYGGGVVMEVPGTAPAKLPIIVQCKNASCRKRYQFVALVDEDM